MYRKRGLFLSLFVLTNSACATHSSLGESYHAKQKYDLSVYYYANPFYRDRKSEKKQKDLIRSITSSEMDLQKKFDDAWEAEDYISALKVAVRHEELLTWAYHQQIANFHPRTVQENIQKAKEKALQQVQKNVDLAADKSPEAEMVALREALGLDPNNEELATRYDRIRLSNQRRIRATTNCPSNVKAQCEQALSKLIANITVGAHEKFLITRKTDGDENVDLVLSMSIRESSSDWALEKSGNSQEDITLYNEFKEPLLDSKGKIQTQKVSVFWNIYNASSSSEVNIEVKMTSLWSDKEVLFQKSLSKSDIKIQHYYEYSGDYRALPFTVKQHDSNKEPPPEPNVLTRSIQNQILSSMTESILKKME